MALLPADYYARCTNTDCSWERSTSDREYRDDLARRHERNYHEHHVQTTDLT